MAYDVTSLTTAIAQGQINEDAARALINEQIDWEIRAAKLLNVTTENMTPDPVVEQVESVQEVQTPPEQVTE